MKELPLVSVIVPCYNHAAFLADALDSVRSQSCQSWECIIIDDGSSDNTSTVAASAVSEDKKIRYFQQTNAGLSSARNLGIKHAIGTYLVFLDADDMLYPHMFEVLMNALQECDSVMAIGGWDYSRNGLHDIFKSSRLAPIRGNFFQQLTAGNLFPCHAAMVKREWVVNAGMFDTELRSCEDWDLWLRISRMTNEFCSVPDTVSVYRMLTTSMTRNVDVFLRAGLKVHERCTRPDSRINHPLAENTPGYKGNAHVFLHDWYLRAVSQYLVQNNPEAAFGLVVELGRGHGIVPVMKDLELIWKHWAFYKMLRPDEARDQWKNVRPLFMEYIDCINRAFPDHPYGSAAIRMLDGLNSRGFRRLIQSIRKHLV